MGAGLLPSELTAYIKDQEIPSHAEAVRLAELLGTTASWLLHGKHPNAPKL
jgi:hypothetical protein